MSLKVLGVCSLACRGTFQCADLPPALRRLPCAMKITGEHPGVGGLISGHLEAQTRARGLWREELFLRPFQIPAGSAMVIRFILKLLVPESFRHRRPTAVDRGEDAVTLCPFKQPVACQALCMLSRSLRSVNEERGPRQDGADGERASWGRADSCCPLWRGRGVSLLLIPYLLPF